MKSTKKIKSDVTKILNSWTQIDGIHFDTRPDSVRPLNGQFKSQYFIGLNSYLFLC